MELKCQYCERYLGKAHGTIIATLKCSNTSCKAENQFKIVEADISKSLTFKFTEEPAKPKEKKNVSN